jgi:hypothetical protein
MLVYCTQAPAAEQLVQPARVHSFKPPALLMQLMSAQRSNPPRSGSAVPQRPYVPVELWQKSPVGQVVELQQ